VLVGVRRRGDAAILEVHDTGPGVAEEDRERIFEEFERSKQAAHGQNDGLGLGLSIVRRLCTLLGHRITLTSRRGRGTVFRVELPLAPHDLAPVEAPPLPADVSLAGRRILILDDEPMIVTALAGMLRDDGATVVAATTSEEATAALGEAAHVDLAIIDLQLERGVDGLGLIGDWRRNGLFSGPALIVTGATDPGTLARLQASGIGWLTKPVAVPVLRTSVARLMA